MLGSSLPSSCQDLKRYRILVVGDVMIDHHFYCEKANILDHGRTRASEEIHEASKETVMPGGAARVAAILASLCCHTCCIGVVGAPAQDERGALLRRLLKDKWNVDPELEDAPHRPTTLKLRIHVGEHITRADHEITDSIEPEVESKVLAKLGEQIPSCSAVLIQDYEKGTITSKVVDHASDLAKHQNIPLIVGPRFHWDKFENARITAILPDLDEFFRGALHLDPTKRKLPQSLEDSHLREALDRWPEIDAWCITLTGGSVRVVWRAEMDGPFETRSGLLQPVGQGRRATVLGGKAAFTAGYMAGFVHTQSVPQAARLGSLVAETQVQGEPESFVSFEDVKAKSSEFLPKLPEHAPLVREWEQRVYDLLRSLDMRTIEEELPGIVDLRNLIQKIREFLQSQRTLLLVIGGPGSGKTMAVETLLDVDQIQVHRITRDEVTRKGLSACLRGSVGSGKPVLFMDELLTLQNEFFTCSGSLMTERKLLLDGDYVSLRDGQKILATGNHVLNPLTQDLKDRFGEPNIIEVKPPTEPLEIIDIFGMGLLQREKDVKTPKTVVWAVLRKAREEKDNASRRTICGWGAEMNKRLRDAAGKDFKTAWSEGDLGDQWLRVGSQMQDLDRPITFRRAQVAPPQRPRTVAAE